MGLSKGAYVFGIYVCTHTLACTHTYIQGRLQMKFGAFQKAPTYLAYMYTHTRTHTRTYKAAYKRSSDSFKRGLRIWHICVYTHLHTHTHIQGRLQMKFGAFQNGPTYLAYMFDSEKCGASQKRQPLKFGY